MSHRGTDRAGLAPWAGLLPPLAALALGHLLGRGALAGPALLHPPTWPSWWQARPPAVAAFALLREGAMVSAGYVLAVWSLAAAAGTARPAHRVLGVLAKAGAPGAARALSLSLRLSIGVSAAAAQPLPGPAVAASAPHQAPHQTRHQASQQSTAPPVLRYVGPAHPTQPAARSRIEWVVRPGDNIWSIAASTITRATPAGATTPEIAGYWWQTVELNRPRLPDPADPSLLYPGDVVELPRLPTEPGEQADWSA